MVPFSRLIDAQDSTWNSHDKIRTEKANAQTRRRQCNDGWRSRVDGGRLGSGKAPGYTGFGLGMSESYREGCRNRLGRKNGKGAIHSSRRIPAGAVVPMKKWFACSQNRASHGISCEPCVSLSLRPLCPSVRNFGSSRKTSAQETI